MFMYINIAENAHWDIYAPPPPLQIITQIFFHFRCILLQISPQKCFFISISILGDYAAGGGMYICVSAQRKGPSIGIFIRKKIRFYKAVQNFLKKIF